jgi:hypothetical protein
MAFDTAGTPNTASGTDRPPASIDGDRQMMRVPLAEFAAYVVERGEGRPPDANYANIADGIDKLTAVLIDLVSHQNVDSRHVWDRIDQLAVNAELLQDSPFRARRARVAREAFTAATDVMAAIQAWQYPHLDRAMGEVRDAARNIRLDQPLHEQTDTVQRFFERSHDLLRAMSG